ncbi:BTB/POZ protein [Elsinoe ampelina]|uniref:BTB/POZ protein n=1 Tax=Elsinoe ampelina TaxID=302913 RepID=A0A6A6G467_9PEZI|nr:BTB/POZ protein [Elsinoe ampelina]
MALRRSSSSINVYARFADNEELSDITICYGGKEFRAHKFVLIAHSDYFKAFLTGHFQEAGKSKVRLESINNDEGHTWTGQEEEFLTLMLRSLYDKDMLDQHIDAIFTPVDKAESAVGLYLVADMYQVSVLKLAMVEKLVDIVTIMPWDKNGIDKVVHEFSTVAASDLRPFNDKLVKEMRSGMFLVVIGLESFRALLKRDADLAIMCMERVVKNAHMFGTGYDHPRMCAICGYVITCRENGFNAAKCNGCGKSNSYGRWTYELPSSI